MSADDDDFDDDELEDGESSPEGGGEEDGLSEFSPVEEDDEHSIGISKQKILKWLTARRGWVLVVGLSIAQAVFGSIMYYLRSKAKPVTEISAAAIRELAIDMLGHEVKIDQIYQLVPMRGGKRMTIGLDVVLILGQLPAEQVEGAPRPNDEEFALFVATIQSMEPAIRSRVNMLLQQIPANELGTVESQKAIKRDLQNYVNDTLEGLDFGKSLRKDIGKRRVTDVLLPMFVRQFI